MLSSVLNSDTAIEINRGIMRAFVAIRRVVATPPSDKLAELLYSVLYLTFPLRKG